MSGLSRWRGSIVLALIVITFLYYIKSPFLPDQTERPQRSTSTSASTEKQPPKSSSETPSKSPSKPAEIPLQSPPKDSKDTKFNWATLPQKYPVSSIKSLPSGHTASIPKIQFDFKKESPEQKKIRLERLQLVKGNFTHAWNGYKEHAWLRDEVKPISGQAEDPFGGWAASMVDSLDTLWIMGLHTELKEAINALNAIDFSTCALDELNVFETTIRYLGGFLSIHDLTSRKYPILLQKATELGEMLYHAFDTPNRLPIVRWNFKDAASGKPQEANDNVLVSEPGSLTLEFTRLSQVTGDMKYFDAVQRIMDLFDKQQSITKLPGMWPVIIDLKHADVKSYSGFTIGGMADSLYEYLPKQHLLLGGSTQQYRRMYEYALIAMKRNIFYRPMTRDERNVRLAGNVDSDGKTHVSELKTDSQAQHLSCFAGGMVSVAAKVFESEEDAVLGRRLVEGCLWAYEVQNLGVMPEIMHAVKCESEERCVWDEGKWVEKVGEMNDGEGSGKEKVKRLRLNPGVAKVDDGRYILRPEAIESIFILYRITGDTTLQDRAWAMFNNITKYTLTPIGHAGIDDITAINIQKQDRMESFWMAETLKYFYLIFAEPDLVSLDDYVFNTEAHPLRRAV